MVDRPRMVSPRRSHALSSRFQPPSRRANMGGEKGDGNMRHSIVTGVDGSEESRVAALVAADLAQELDLQLVIVHAADDPPTFPYGDRRLTELQRRRDDQAVQRLLDSIAGSLSVVPKTRIVYEDPVDALNLVAADEQAELLVV